MVHRSMANTFLKFFLKQKQLRKFTGLNTSQISQVAATSCSEFAKQTHSPPSAHFPPHSPSTLSVLFKAAGLYRYKALHFAPLSYHFTSYRSAASQSVSDVESISIYLQPGSTLTA